MISIHFIVPYPELEGAVRQLLEKYNTSGEIQYRTTVVSHIDDPINLNQCDIIVARGYIAHLLKTSDIPVITIRVSAYDIIRALNACVQLYHPRKIGLIWSEEMLEGADELCRLYECPIQLYKIESQSFDAAIHKAIGDGCDAFVGGYILKTALKEKFNYTIIKTSQDTLAQSLEEAVRTVRVIHQEREHSEIYQIVAQQSKSAIAYVDSAGYLKLTNQKAICMFNGWNVSSNFTKNARLCDVFPFLQGGLDDVIRSQRAIHNKLLQYGGEYFSADFTPVFVSEHINGIVITFQNVTEIQKSELKIRTQLSEKGLTAKYHFNHIIGRSKIMQETISVAAKYGGTLLNILIYGESGTGKELLAQSIHNVSPCKNGPFVAVNCAAITESLIESEMFGYADGAFTGAVKGGKTGLFGQAHNGTLFLDEVSELPYSFQGKLLRALQEKEIRRVGDDRVIKVNIRIIAAANKNLLECVSKGTFREDLFYRLDVLRVNIPPLRNRPEDIVDIFSFYLNQNYEKQGLLPPPTLSADAMAELQQFSFPGNIRQLRNIADRVSVICCDGEISRDRLLSVMDEAGDTLRCKKSVNASFKKAKRTVEEETALLLQILGENNWNIQKTAACLGIDRTTLWRKMKKYSLSP